MTRYCTDKKNLIQFYSLSALAAPLPPRPLEAYPGINNLTQFLVIYTETDIIISKRI